MDLLKTKEICSEGWNDGALCSQSKEEIGPVKHKASNFVSALYEPQGTHSENVGHQGSTGSRVSLT